MNCEHRHRVVGRFKQVAIGCAVFVLLVTCTATGHAGTRVTIRILGDPVNLWFDKQNRMLTVKLNPPNTGDATKDAEYLAAARMAMMQWTEMQTTVFGGLGFMLKEVNVPDKEADIVINWTDKSLGEHAAEAKTTGERAGSRNQVDRYTKSHVEIMMSTKVNSEFRNADAMKRLLQHELGHAEGLPDIYVNPDADGLMHGRPRPGQNVQDLMPVDLLNDFTAIGLKSEVHDIRKKKTLEALFIRRTKAAQSPGAIYEYRRPAFDPNLFPAPALSFEPIHQIGVRLGAEPTDLVLPTGWTSEFVVDDFSGLLSLYTLNGFEQGWEPDRGVGWLYLSSSAEEFDIHPTDELAFSFAFGVDPEQMGGRLIYVVEQDNRVTALWVVPEPAACAMIGTVIFTAAGFPIRRRRG